MKNQFSNPWMRTVSIMLMLLLVLTGGIQTTNAQSLDQTNSIDVVIVMDNSRSMHHKDENQRILGNDVMGYRIDAAQMFLSMCDMNHSRVAFMPFSLTVDSNPTFQNVDTKAKRDDLIAEMEHFRSSTRYDTNLGLALNAAVKLLEDRENKTNRPVILVLTDGENDIDPNHSRSENMTVEQWNSSAKIFEQKRYDRFYTNDSDTLCDLAKDAAVALNIPIHTIPLNLSSVDPYCQRLQAMSDATGGTCYILKSSNIQDLPKQFSEILASEIGSSLSLELSPKLLNDGTYEVAMPILNDSVLEANIYIPLYKEAGVIASSIKLIAPDGTDYTSTYAQNENVMHFETQNRFRLYKLIAPIQKGDWSLHFSLEEDAVPDNIALNLLYNYNLRLQGEVGTDLDHLYYSEFEANKNDTLYLRTFLMDNQTSAPASDEQLYSVYTDKEPWYTINARYEWLDENDHILFSGTLSSNEKDHFETHFDLTTMVTEGGFNRLPAGDYRIRLIVEGVGLFKETSIPVHLVNTPPHCDVSSFAQSVVVDDPDEPTTQAPMFLSYKVSDAFSDADNDRLTYQLQLAEEEDIVDLQLSQKADGLYVEGWTKADVQNDSIRYGQQSCNLLVSDGTDDISIPFALRITNKSFSDKEHQRTWEMVGVTNNQAEKNSDITVSFHLSDANGRPITANSIQYYDVTIEVSDANDVSKLFYEGSMERTEPAEDLTLSYTFQTLPTMQDYAVTLLFEYDGVFFAEESQTFSVQNTPPEMIVDANLAISDQLKFLSKDVFYPILESVSSEEQLCIPFGKLFADADNETNHLHYEVIVSDDTLLSYTTDDTLLTLTPQKQGTVTLSLFALDGDGVRSPELVKTLTITDLTASWQTFWIAVLIALVIVTLLLRMLIHLLKPHYNPLLTMETYEGNAFAFSTAVTLPSRGNKKKTVPLVRQLDQTLLNNNGLSIKALESIQMKPASGSQSIRIWTTKPLNVQTSLGASPLSKKPLTWSKDQELTILSAQGSIRIKLAGATNISDFGTSTASANGFGTSTANANGFGTSTVRRRK